MAAPVAPPHPKSRLPRVVWLSVIVLAGLFAVAGIVAATHWPFTRAKIISTLQDESSGKVTIAAFRQTYWPHPGCIAESVVIRQPADRPGAPMISIPKLVVEGSYTHLLTLSKHLRRIRTTGMQIRVPERQPRDSGSSKGFKFELGDIIADQTLLEFPSAKGSKPYQIQIDRAVLSDVRANQALRFETDLRIPQPAGEIHASGRFGPWRAGNAYQTPVSGAYTFNRANLGVFEGLGGTLHSEGKFDGVLEKINVAGSTDVPDFLVKSAGHPVHLKTSFRAVVNGRNGDVLLQGVEADFLGTRVITTGAIADAGHLHGKTATLEMKVEQGRIQDFLRLLSHTPAPPMTGALVITAHVVLPPEDRRFMEKLRLRANFSISRALFTAPQTREGIDRINRHAKIDKQPEPARDGDTLSDLKGRVDLANGVARFPNATFGFPGALASVGGTCNMLTERIDLHGTVRLEEKLSQTTKGIRSVLLKVIDPFFKKKHRRESVVPMKITGTFDQPSLGLELGGKQQ